MNPVRLFRQALTSPALLRLGSSAARNSIDEPATKPQSSLGTRAYGGWLLKAAPTVPRVTRSHPHTMGSNCHPGGAAGRIAGAPGMQGVATPCAKPGSAPPRPFLHVSQRPRDAASGRSPHHEALNHEPNSRYAERRPSLLLAHHKRLPNSDHYLALLNRAHRLRGRGPDCSPRPCTVSCQRTGFEACCRASR
jgi:hypothetical protein